MSAFQIGALAFSFIAGLLIGAVTTSKERKALHKECGDLLDEIARLERELSNTRLANQNIKRIGYVRANGFRS